MNTLKDAAIVELLKKYSACNLRYISYPPTHMFRPTFGWQEYLAALNELPLKPLSLYVRVPYCRSRCGYCGSNGMVTHDQGWFRTYLDYVQREMGLIRGQLASEQKVVQVYLGGGSTGYIHNRNKCRLISVLTEQFDIARTAEIGIEIDPQDVQPGDAEALKTTGFNYVSIRVQDLHPQVLSALNRNQTEVWVQQLFDELRAAGFTQVNIDLMMGLPKQSLSTFKETLAQVIRMNPERITLSSFADLSILPNSQGFINPTDLPSLDEKLQMLPVAVERLTSTGYVHIGMGHFAKSEDSLPRAQRTKTLRRLSQGYTTHPTCNLLAFGHAAISQLELSYVQNHQTMQDYFRSIDAGFPATAKGYRLQRIDQIRRDVIQQLICELALSTSQVEQRWRINFNHYFAREIEHLNVLEADGLIDRLAWGWRVTAIGRLLLPALARVFAPYCQQTALLPFPHAH